jgi:chromosome segregation ATPase
LLKGQIIHCPESTQTLLEDFKDRIEKIKLNNTEIENIIKYKEKDYSNLLFLSKLVNDYEAILNELEKANIKINSLNTNIDDLNEAKAKKEKIITEKESQIDTIIKSLTNIDDYIKEYLNKQKKNLEAKEDYINSEKERYNKNMKRLTELNKLVQEQTEANTNIENNVYNTNVDFCFGSD